MRGAEAPSAQPPLSSQTADSDDLPATGVSRLDHLASVKVPELTPVTAVPASPGHMADS